MRIITGLMLAVVLSVAPSAMGASSLHHSLVEKQNVVRGTTAADIYRDLLRHPIIDPDAGRSFANLTHEHDFDLETDASGGQCRVTRLDFTWRFVITLPEAKDEASLPNGTRKLWHSFVARLRSHELHHRNLFLDCAKTFLPHAAALTAPQCSQLDRNVRRDLDAQYNSCMDRQAAYDRADTPRILSHAFIEEAKQGK